jgi:hypothetical protein
MVDLGGLQQGWFHCAEIEGEVGRVRERGIHIGKEGCMIHVDTFTWTICCLDTMMVHK